MQHIKVILMQRCQADDHKLLSQMHMWRNMALLDFLKGIIGCYQHLWADHAQSQAQHALLGHACLISPVEPRNRITCSSLSK